MPRFPFSSYLRRHRRRRRLRGFRIFETRNVPRIQSTCVRRFSAKIPFTGNGALTLALTLSPNGDALYMAVADPLAARRYISFHFSLLSPGALLLFIRTLDARSTNTFFLHLVSRVEEVTLRCNDGRCSYANLGRFDGSIRCSR